MKKVTKIFGLCALMAFGVMSCKKSEQKEFLSFKAIINQPTCNSKTHIDNEYIVRWDAGDQARVYIQDGTDAVFTTQNQNATTTATFTLNPDQDPLPESDEYAIFYPAQLASKKQSNNKISLTFPEEQVYVEDGFATNTFPMAAIGSGSGSGSDLTFDFSTPCGLLCLQLYGKNEGITIGSIQLEDKDTRNPIAGTLTVNVNDIKVEELDDENYDPTELLTFLKDFQKYTLTLNCPNGGVPLNTSATQAKKFYFVVPTYPERFIDAQNEYHNTIPLVPDRCQVFSKGFIIKIYDNEGSKIMEKEAIPNLEVEPKIDYTMEAKKIIQMAPLEVSYQNN